MNAITSHNRERALELLRKVDEHYTSLQSFRIPTRPLTKSVMISIAERIGLYDDWHDSNSAQLKADLGYLHFIGALTKTPHGIYRGTPHLDAFLHSD